MNINDKFIVSFFNVCKDIYNYDETNKDVEIKNLEEFIENCNKKLAIIEDNELLNTQIDDFSNQVNKLTNKIKSYEKKYTDLYVELTETKKKVKNADAEKENFKNKNNELYSTKSKYEKEIELYKQKLLKNKQKMNEYKTKNDKIYTKLTEYVNLVENLQEQNNTLKNNNTDLNNNLSNINNKYSEEIKKLEDIKKAVGSKISSDTMEHLDISIIEAIDRANEYEKKYNETIKQNEILKTNYDDLNGKYINLLSTQTNETNELKSQIKLLLEQMQNDRKHYNDNIILLETKNKIEKQNNNVEKQKGGDNGIKYIDIKDKKALEIFDKDIQLFNERENDVINTGEKKNNYENISFSTDYMVDLLQMSDKMVKTNKINVKNNKNLDTIDEENDIESEDDKNNIFIKKSNYGNGYINLANMKILNSEEEKENKDKNTLRNELNNFITQNQNIDNIVYTGGGKKNKIEIRQIDDKFKMKFDNDFSTITEQNVNFDNEKEIKKIRHRKYMRHNREQKKNTKLQDLFNLQN